MQHLSVNIFKKTFWNQTSFEYAQEALLINSGSGNYLINRMALEWVISWIGMHIVDYHGPIFSTI